MNDIYRPGDTVISYFGHQSSTGFGTPATSITPAVYRNQNLDTTNVPTFTHLGTGAYRNTYVIPGSFEHGDQVTILAQATLTGTPAPPVPIWEGRLVSHPTNALPSGGYATGGGLPSAAQIRMEMDANSTHLLSMDNRLPGTPSTFGQIGTPSNAINGLAYEIADTNARVRTLPSVGTIKASLQDDRVTGVTTGSITTTSVPTTGSELSSSDDAYNGAFLLATSGALKGVGRKITDYTGSSKTFTTQAFPSALATGVTVSVIGNVPT